MDFQRKNKKIFFVGGLVLSVLLLALFMYFRSNHGMLATGRRAASSISWQTFEGTNPPFNFVFEYPGPWEAKEIKLAKAFNMAQVLGPQDKVTKFIPGIYIKIKEYKGGDLSSKFSETLLEKEGQFRGFKKLHEGHVMIAGINGSYLGYQYILPLPMRSMNAKDTVVRREEVLVENGGKSYQLSFWATEEQFKADQVVFKHVLKTFKFKE
ncbi:MAG: hypothetical protein ABH891_05230 [Candidatus Omnitrophota bacterium]